MENFQKTWEEVVELKARVAALIRKAEIREMSTEVIDKHTVVIEKLSEVEKALEELDGVITNNYNTIANGNDRDKKIFLLDKSTFPDALTFSESDLEAMVASGNYFDDDIIKIDANGYDSVREAIKNEWCNLSSESLEDDLERVFNYCYVISFGF